MVEAEEAVHPRWKVCFCFSLESRVSLCHAGMHALRSSFRSRRNGLTFPRILCVLDLEGDRILRGLFTITFICVIAFICLRMRVQRTRRVLTTR